VLVQIRQELLSLAVLANLQQQQQQQRQQQCATRAHVTHGEPSMVQHAQHSTTSSSIF
jgi:hypothetical protein